MNVQEALNDFGSTVAALKAADIVVDTKGEELDNAATALKDANSVQHGAKLNAKVSFDAVLAEVSKLGLDSVVVPPAENDDVTVVV